MDAWRERRHVQCASATSLGEEEEAVQLTRFCPHHAGQTRQVVLREGAGHRDVSRQGYLPEGH